MTIKSHKLKLSSPKLPQISLPLSISASLSLSVSRVIGKKKICFIILSPARRVPLDLMQLEAIETRETNEMREAKVLSEANEMREAIVVRGKYDEGGKSDVGGK